MFMNVQSSIERDLDESGSSHSKNEKFRAFSLTSADCHHVVRGPKAAFCDYCIEDRI